MTTIRENLRQFEECRDRGEAITMWESAVAEHTAQLTRVLALVSAVEEDHALSATRVEQLQAGTFDSNEHFTKWSAARERTRRVLADMRAAGDIPSTPIASDGLTKPGPI